jgi:hypothetical protein
MFYYDYPTNLLNISGPFTMINSAAFIAYDIFLAISVFPVPGGPYKSNPLTCLIFNFSNKEGGNLLDAKILRKIVSN